MICLEGHSLFDKLARDPVDYPLFQRIHEVLRFAPSSRHANEEELVSLSVDALDYLKADGLWETASTTGRTALQWNGRALTVSEDDDRQFRHQHTFEIDPEG